MKRPTQADVARVAGVSRATVSYVLNGNTKKRIPISEETRQRVLNAIEELGYEIDARAQALRSGSTKTLGVLVPLYENPFFWQILFGISSEAGASGYSLLLAQNSSTPELEHQSIRELAEQRVDGVLLLTSFEQLSKPVVSQLRKTSRPIVEIAATTSEFDYVHQGYGQGALMLMEHLMELGHQRIGFVYGVETEEQGWDRLSAYRQALENAGLPYDETLVRYCGHHMEDGYEATLELLKHSDRPTAIITINDLLGMATLRAAADLGLRVPEDLSVGSFDDIPFTNFSIPRLTTVAGFPEELGRNAVKMILKRIADPDCEQQIATSRWQLTVRESTGPVPQT